MISISNEIKAQIKTIKESLSSSFSKPTTSLSQKGSAPFVTYIDDDTGERTAVVFVYGSSDYGGEDIVIASSTDRKVFRKFLEVN